MKNNIIQTLKILLVAVVLSFGISYVYAWTGPTVAPPGGNTPEPINIGGKQQDKAGNFRAGGLRSFGDLIVDNGITLGGVREVSWPSVPSGAIMMFDGVCPSSGGWSEYTALRGRVPRGEPNGNGASLGQGGSDNAIVVAHSHTLTMNRVGNHTHSVTGGGGGRGSSGFSTVDTGTKYGSVTTSSAGAHTPTGTIGSSGVSGINKNIPRYQEVIFCLKN